MAEEIENISAEAIGRNLKTRFVGRRLAYYPSVASTMELALEEAREGASEGSVVIAGEQTSGKGRRNRVWLSPPGSISLSLVLRPQDSNLAGLVMVAALAVASAIEKVTGLRPGIKWPNDVLINRRKVCGILIETKVGRGSSNYAVVGIGINVNLRLADYPDIAPLATSLSDELGGAVSRLDLLCRLLEEFERLYLAASAGNSVFDQWRARLVTLGKRVTASCEGTRLEGMAESVAPDGSLMLRHSDGTLSRIVAGDVSLRDD
ncbi:MAG: biotin--[acetyl-CoA-carboxylase] ligase [Dehalococcoidales bacterium]